MSDFTGPISTLPGAGHVLPEGTLCDEHPDRPAVARIQGETDSFGCELYDCCAECRDAMREEMRQARHGQCEWCKQEATDLRDRRDDEEGSYGRVYSVCGSCVKRQEDRWQRELDSYGDCWGGDDD